MTTNIVLIIYALFLILGGLMGLKKGSKVSLITGSSSGILVFVGLWLMSFKPHTAWIFLTCLNVLLLLAFVSRLLKTKKFMPSGMLLTVTLAILLFCLIHLHVQ